MLQQKICRTNRIGNLERRTTERILDCTGSPSVDVPRVNNYWNAKDNVLCRHECIRGRAFAFPSSRQEKKFLRWQNEYVPMTCKIITSIMWMEIEKNRTKRSFTLISYAWLNKFDLFPRHYSHAYLIAHKCTTCSLPSFATRTNTREWSILLNLLLKYFSFLM